MDERSEPTHPAIATVSFLPPPGPPGRGPAEGPLPDGGGHESAARVQAERELRNTLLAEGFGGPAYAALAGYGHQLMKAWLSTGYIFVRCREEGLDLLSLPIAFSDQEDLAQQAVAEALRTFHDGGLKKGGWRPDGGASLTSYFVGALLRHFANIWRRRLRDRVNQFGPSCETLSYESESLDSDPADICAQRDEIRRALAIENVATRTALVLTAEGYTQEEIAEVLGVTRRAVEGLLRRHRSRVMARSGGGRFA